MRICMCNLAGGGGEKKVWAWGPYCPLVAVQNTVKTSKLNQMYDLTFWKKNHSELILSLQAIFSRFRWSSKFRQSYSHPAAWIRVKELSHEYVMWSIKPVGNSEINFCGHAQFKNKHSFTTSSCGLLSPSREKMNSYTHAPRKKLNKNYKSFCQRRYLLEIKDQNRLRHKCPTSLSACF
jgi:hypothetical protein